MKTLVYGSSIKGNGHFVSGTECQDSNSFLETDFSEDEIKVIALSDGHGGAPYLRSAQGSKLAVEIAKKELYEFVHKVKDLLDEIDSVQHIINTPPPQFVIKVGEKKEPLESSPEASLLKLRVQTLEKRVALELESVKEAIVKAWCKAVDDAFASEPIEIVEAEESILHDIAIPFAFVLAPIVGVTLWQLAAAAVTGFIAKENVVGTLAVCFVGLENFIDTEELAILEGSGAEVAGIIAITKVAALAYLMFNLFSPPCFAAIGAMNAEMKSKKWLWSGIGLQLGVGYTVAFLTFFFGTLFTTGDFGSVWMPILGWAVVIVFALILTILIVKKNNELKTKK